MLTRELCCSLAVVLLATTTVPLCFAVRAGPDGRTRIICLGDVIQQYGTYNSFTVISYDPAIRATMIPSRPDYLGGYDHAYRNMRMYMPRTYPGLVEDYDLILMSDADRLVFKSEWISWLSNSVPEDGLGILWLGSIVEEIAVGWDDTTLADTLPAAQAPGQYTRTQTFWLRIIDRDELLMQALPWEKTPALANVNAQVPKDGSELWAEVYSSWETQPLMIYWENGKGAALDFTSKFPVGVQPWYEDWNLFPQAMIYLAYRTADRALPNDPLMFQTVMNAFIEFSQRSSLVNSMLDWVEKFGGNPAKLRERLEDVNDMKGEADSAYLAGDFETALALVRDAEAEHDLLRAAAMDAKDEALLWVYLTEWCVLMGTLLISSYALWLVMVRRRLYREVASSHLRREFHES